MCLLGEDRKCQEQAEQDSPGWLHGIAFRDWSGFDRSWIPQVKVEGGWFGKNMLEKVANRKRKP